MSEHNWVESKHSYHESLEIAVCSKCHVEQVEIEHEVDCGKWHGTHIRYIYLYRSHDGTYHDDEPECITEITQ